MTRRRALATCALAAIALAAGCSDNESIGPNGRAEFAAFVSIGTSVSMGTMSDGVVYSGQQHSWTAQLAHLANVGYTEPLIQAPGCNPPLIAPLQLQVRLDGTPVTQTDVSCAPLFSGITPPTNNVAIDGATALTALTFTPESALVHHTSRGNGEIYNRVLAPGQTQVTAMMAEHPTFVSVELGANEVLKVSSGIIVPNLTLTPPDSFYKYYDPIIDSVKKTGAKAVLVGLVDDVSTFPGLRKGSELFADRAAFLSSFYVNVSDDCTNEGAANLIFVPLKLPPVLAAAQAAAVAQQAPPTLSCADVPGTQDAVLTPADVQIVNQTLAAMNAHIQGLATANGYAFFELSALYELQKPPFSILGLLGAPNPLLPGPYQFGPFGPNISLDGVHPTAAGHSYLADAAVAAIDQTYGLDIPIIPGFAPVAVALQSLTR